VHEGDRQSVPAVPACRRYWLLWSLRVLMPRASSWRVAQFDTLRLRLIKVAARIVEMKTKIRDAGAPPVVNSGVTSKR
jgi:hypothetical protein